MAKAKENNELEAAVAPVVAFNKLIIKSVEDAFNLNMATMQTYTKLGLDNFNAGLGVGNADDLKVYAEKQKDLAQELTTRATSHVKELGELNGKFIEQARGLAEENIKGMTAKVAA